jgi:hypothetical protein
MHEKLSQRLICIGSSLTIHEWKYLWDEKSLQFTEKNSFTHLTEIAHRTWGRFRLRLLRL